VYENFFKINNIFLEIINIHGSITGNISICLLIAAAAVQICVKNQLPIAMFHMVVSFTHFKCDTVFNDGLITFTADFPNDFLWKLVKS